MSDRVYNFSAGPAVFPEEVLKKAQAEMLNWNNSGRSVLELSHRSPEFESIMTSAESNLRTLLNIPSNYKVLFLQGGGFLQFYTVPANLLGDKQRADYIITGSWSKTAVEEGRKFIPKVNIVASTETDRFTTLPNVSQYNLPEDPNDTAYVFFCANETIHGVEFSGVPEILAERGFTVVSDMSSNFLSRRFDITQYGAVFAAAQKNFGPAGLAVVIVREDLLGRARSDLPTVLDFSVLAANNSMKNTPPTYSIYLANLTMQWILDNGGLQAIEEKNIRKSAMLYECIDNSKIYKNPVAKEARSRMNIPFTFNSDVVPKEKIPELEKRFTADAAAAGLVTLEGHRSVGGFRASIYNAMPEAGVAALVSFMNQFEQSVIAELKL